MRDFSAASVVVPRFLPLVGLLPAPHGLRIRARLLTASPDEPGRVFLEESTLMSTGGGESDSTVQRPWLDGRS